MTARFDLPSRAPRLSGAVVFLWLILAVGPARAQVPLTIHYQGYVVSSAGAPLNGPIELRLSLYGSASDEKPVWSEGQGVTASNGVFSVQLGIRTPLDVRVFDKGRWLGVQVEGDKEMTPRQQLGSVPYAFTAQQLAGTIQGSQIAGSIQGSQITGTISGAAVPGAAPWVSVAGTSQQALSNAAYMVTGVAPAIITLPAAPAIGDIVKVSAQGLGGWTLAPNAGQSIAGGDFSVSFTARESVRNWVSVASSADGIRLVAAAGGFVDGKPAPEFIYTSTDGGITWTQRASARDWRSVASSADGTKLVAAASSDQIYTSTDSGVTWTPREGVRSWIAVATSTDGAKLVAAPANGVIYASSDSGVTWTPGTINTAWRSVASSADGSRLAALQLKGQIYTSYDGGATWVGRESFRTWSSIAASADGARLAAVVDSGEIFTSGNSGVTWTARESARAWSSIASSTDGTRLVAAVARGLLYTASIYTSLTGVAQTSAELVYAGNGQWIVVSQYGVLTTP